MGARLTRPRLASPFCSATFVPALSSVLVHATLGRLALFLSAQYCGQRFPTHDLTFDHVVPRCQGGRSNWQNVVAACVNCNHRKGNRTLAQLKRSGETVLRRTPVQPTNAQLQVAARRYPPRYCHLTWRDYLYWDTELTD